jgi:hypothetical protein
MNTAPPPKGDEVVRRLVADDSTLVAQEVEQALLGALLNDNGAFKQVAHLIGAADFYFDNHRAIYAAIERRIRRGELADIVMLPDELLRVESNADPAVLIAYLAELAQHAPYSGNAARYAMHVRDKALSRISVAECLDFSRRISQSRGGDVAALIAELRTKLGNIAQQGGAARGLRILSAADFLNAPLPELEVQLGPWLLQKTLCMLYARRGVGKTHFALGVANAVASGCSFLGWRAPKPRGVVLIDGEMPAQVMQRRLREVASGNGEVPELLRIVTPDLQDRPMPDLATAAGQAEVDDVIADDTALIIVDNLSCLVRSGGAENESESWTGVSEWALRHRRAGRSIIFVHHSGKNGTQRGTSKREDLLDVIINLRRPSEYSESDGAVFEVHFEKGRSLTGDDIAPIEARLQQVDGGQAWTYSSAATKSADRIVALWEGGMLSLNDVVREAGCAKSHGHKTLAAAMQAGRLARAYPQRRKETK